MHRALLWLIPLSLVLAGCGNSKNKTTPPPPSNQPLTVEGTWNLTSTNGGNGSSGFTATIVAQTPQGGTCSVTTPVGSFSVSGMSSCFIADPYEGQGSITGVSGKWDYPPAGFMFGLTSSDPVPSNSTAQMVGFFVESNGVSVEVLDINGTVTATTKNISGSYACDSTSPIACSWSGTFNGYHQ